MLLCIALASSTQVEFEPVIVHNTTTPFPETAKSSGSVFSKAVGRKWWLIPAAVLDLKFAYDAYTFSAKIPRVTVPDVPCVYPAKSLLTKIYQEVWWGNKWNTLMEYYQYDNEPRYIATDNTGHLLHKKIAGCWNGLYLTPEPEIFESPKENGPHTRYRFTYQYI